MKRRPRERLNGDAGQIKFTSMIDVVFLLLIFFLCASRFSEREKILDAQLPRAGT